MSLWREVKDILKSNLNHSSCNIRWEKVEFQIKKKKIQILLFCHFGLISVFLKKFFPNVAK